MLADEVLDLYEQGRTEELRLKALELLLVHAPEESDSDLIVRNAVQILSRKIDRTGLTRPMLASQTESVLAHNFAHGLRFGEELPPFSFVGKGAVSVHEGVLTLALSPTLESRAVAFTLAGGAVELVTRDTRDERLKMTERNEADALDEFADLLTEKQGRMIVRAPRASLQEGDRVTISDFSEENEEIRCLSVGSIREEGTLFNDELVKGTYVYDLLPYLAPDDFIGGACVEMDDEGLGFSIRDAYLAFAIQRAEKARKEQRFFKGRLLDVQLRWQRMLWLTADGFFGISRIREGLKPGDEATLYVVSVIIRQDNFFINVDVEEHPTGEVQPFLEDNVLYGFTTQKAPAKPAKSGGNGKECVRLLAQILEAVHPTGSLEKYRTLLAARFLAVAVGDTSLTDEYTRRAEILQRKLLYAQGKPIRTLAITRYATGCIDAPAEIACLLPTANPEAFLGESGVAGKIAHLLVAARVSNEYPDVVPVKIDDVRRKVSALLGVEDAFRASGVRLQGKYGLSEGNEVEFKSSYVMRNDGGGPDLDYQGRGQVFEAVCGFLNSNGGILFLGVNDSGDPITTPGRGLDGDMKWFQENKNFVQRRAFRLLGHRVPLPENLDKYVLFLQQEKKIYLKESLQDHVTIEPTEDADAIRITVKPAEYEIAYLYRDLTRKQGTAYFRDGNQTLPMSYDAKRRRLMSLKRMDKDIAHLVKLQEAIDRKHKVYLRGYASGNSGETRDRLVVPINLFYDDEKVWCFDLEDRKFKQFNLSRIREVDTDVSDPEYNEDFEPCQADVFGWVEPGQAYSIRLRMETIAHNYLIEHFSAARHLSENELWREDDTHWILATTVYGLAPVRWFYVMLADKIEILDSPDAEILKEEVRKFVQKWLA